MGMHSLEFRREGLSTELQQNGIPDVERAFLMMGESRSSDHSLGINGWPYLTEIKRHFFTQRVVYPLKLSTIESS